MQIRILHTESFRLAALYAAIFAGSVIVLAGLVLFITGQALREQIVQFSQADIAAIRNGYASEGLNEAREVIEQRMAAPAASDFFLLEKDGTRLAGNLPPMAPQIGTQEIHGLQALKARHGVLGVGALLAPNLYVFSGSDLRRSDIARERIWQLLLWLFGPALVLAIAGGALVSRSFLARTDAITRACRAIMDGNLTTRIAVRGTQDEMDRLSETINTMLDRIAALMDNLRQVTNDIAHDLRTPVTHLRQRLERARSDSATPAAYDAALESAIAASDDILGAFGALLRIAQIEGGERRAGFAPLDLAALLEQVREIFTAVAEDAGHRLAADIAGPVMVLGDRELLVQLFSNLIENAILHTPPGTAITLTLDTEATTAIVTVRDTGPGVPADEHEKLFRRLYRREASRNSPGYGLGLALVASVAELHEGRVDLRSDSGRGFSIAVRLPRISPAIASKSAVLYEKV